MIFPGNTDYGLWTNQDFNTAPAVCQDGDLILTGSVGGVQQLYVVNSHGQFLNTLVKVHGAGMFCDAGNKFAYYSAGNSRDPSIWRVPLAGGPPFKLMSLSHQAPVVYSSDGKLAAYVVDDASRATATIINIDRRSIVRELQLINHARGTLPHFTRDGNALAFVEQQKQGFALVLQPIDGLEPRVLTALFKDPISDFGWSPSGNNLAIMWEHATSDVALIKDTATSSRK